MLAKMASNGRRDIGASDIGPCTAWNLIWSAFPRTGAIDFPFRYVGEERISGHELTHGLLERRATDGADANAEHFQ
jgi:hypothetical protein